MSTKVQCLALVAAAGVCAPAFAQDSVSSNGNGDALDPYALNQQCAEYVADLVAFETSKGNVFGVVPLIKSPQADPQFFNNLISAQSISPDLLRNVDNVGGVNFDVWNTAGQGIHPTNNNAPGTAGGPASTTQFAAGFADFGGNYNGVVGAVVNFDPDDPSRLYVTRRQSATNGNTAADNVAQIGYGSIDADGNQYFRADDFGVGGGAGLIDVAGNNLFRVRLLDRNCNARNVISGNAGTFDAADALRINDNNALVAPNMGPESIFGGNGIVATADFNSNFVYGPANPLTLTLGALSGTATRGTVGYSRFNVLGGNGVASYAQLNQDLAGDTVLVNLWEVDATGAPIANMAFQPPASITDNFTGVVINAPGFELDHYHDQQAFRGGAGQIAVTRDPYTGNTLMAVTRDFVANGTNLPLQEVIVGRFDPANTAGIEWTHAGYIDPTLTTGGKPICDANGMAIGRMEELFDVTGGAPVGPSTSSPCIDGGGNVWFISSMGFFDVPVPIQDSASGNVVDFDTALLRAIYDPTTFSYRLEKVLALGDVIRGANSDRNWQITFMGIADGNSISSGTMFSSNASEFAWNGINPVTAEISPEDPRTNGGVVVNVEITYDTNDNGTFDPDTDGDEDYNVLLYIGYPGEQGAFCDCDNNGVLNVDDIDCFVAGFLGGDLATADCDGNGMLNVDDIDCFVACFLAGL